MLRTNKELKRRIIDISYHYKLAHIGSCLTAVDIIKEIYDRRKPGEKFVLSSGHAHLAHLVVKEADGAIDFVREQYVETLIEKYGIHCDRKAGCDVSTGSLGHGIGIALGMALADRSKNVYCLLSDGEMAEGSVWEAMRIKTQYKVNNLKLYLNYNGFAAYQDAHPYFNLEDHSGRDNDGNWLQIPTLGWLIEHVRYTNLHEYPTWLQGQLAHYVIMTKEQYEELMELLQ
jgi:transketolase